MSLGRWNLLSGSLFWVRILPELSGQEAAAGWDWIGLEAKCGYRMSSAVA